MNVIENFSDINETLLKYIEVNSYTFTKYDDCALFYKIEVNSSAVSGVTDCIRIDSDLLVKLL